MPREGSETTRFMTVATPIAGMRSCVLYVPEEWLDDDTATSEGILLKNFLTRKADLAGALRRKYGDYALTQAGEQVDGLQAFWFAKVRTPEEIAVPFRSKRKDRSGIPWPAVLSSVAAANLLGYDSAGTSYVQGSVWDFAWAENYYDGPTKVVEEWFASHTSFTVADPVKMQPKGGTFDYGVGSMTVPECLHGDFTLDYSIAESLDRPAQSFEKIFLATTPTTRPDTMRLEVDENFENGIYVLRTVTAYKP